MLKTEETLRSKGFKVTPQRMAIYELLMNTKSHPSAEDIFKDLLSTNPTISLATVYKTLDSFKNTGLIQELNVGKGFSNYDANVELHPHLVCNGCGKIEDYHSHSNLLNSTVVEQLEKETGYSIENQQIIFYGTCPQCQA